MRIEQIRIKNFRQHKELNLDLNNIVNDVVIIVGTMGAGKTNFLNALVWCLYGVALQDRAGEASMVPNEDSVIATAEGGLVTTAVTIRVSDDELVAEITREQVFRRIGNTAEQIGPASVIVMESRKGTLNYEPVLNAGAWIEKKFPNSLHPYFLFNGEKLGDYFKKSQASKIKDAVLEIAQIDLLERICKTTQDVAKDYTKKYIGASRESDSCEKFVKQYEDASTDHTNYVQKQEELDAKLVEITAQQNQIRNQLLGLHDVKDDTRKLNESDGERDKHERLLEGARVKLARWCIENLPYLEGREQVIALRDELARARVERRMPPKIDITILRELLNNGECICGSKLDRGTSEMKRVEEVLVQYEEVDEIGSKIYFYEDGARDAASVDGLYDHYSLLSEAVLSEAKRVEEIQDEQGRLRKKLSGSDFDSVVKLMNQDSLLMGQRDRISGEISKVDVQIANSQQRMDTARSFIERFHETDGKLARFKGLEGFANRVADAAAQVYETMVNEKRQVVQDAFEKYFVQMHWDGEFVQKVSILDDFTVEIVKATGFLLDSPSAGESLCMALSFSLALTEVSGYNLPIVIDTPMGRLNKDVMDNVSQAIVDNTLFSRGSSRQQFFVLMTETEYNSSTAKVFAKCDPVVMKFHADKHRGITKIEKVGGLDGR